MAGTTGLEPATSCVTGMRSNQLNYVPVHTFNHKNATTISEKDQVERNFPARRKLGGQCPARTGDLLLVRQTL